MTSYVLTGIETLKLPRAKPTVGTRTPLLANAAAAFFNGMLMPPARCSCAPTPEHLDVP